MNQGLIPSINLSFNKFLVILYLCSFIYPCYGSDLYFLCGPDEDGCSEGFYNYCFCIPYNDPEANSPYCLDFNSLSCNPLTKTPNCEPALIYKNQGECLATIFQSRPNTPCLVKSYNFCLEHSIRRCKDNGQLDSCH